ncbi:MAG: pyroglutamyl-peptidase I [Lachnospiraceae bacterium]|nr:pyroglutamyl-peptidase I [Lachnospiraceae bacterium]
MKVLVTGFDPFGGESINPAWEAVKVIKDEIAGAEVVTMQIPTVVGKSIEKIHSKMVEINPDIVIAVGQAGGRFGVTPERVAINVTDARIPDNEGNQPIDEPIFADGDTAYFSNLPVKAMVQAIKDAGYPASLSNTAGTYICNHVMYGILYYIQKEFPHVRGGFIHVPFAASQVIEKPNTPSMAIADITTALEAAIQAAVEYKDDLKIIGGETH